MNLTELSKLCTYFSINGSLASYTVFTSGNINQTYAVTMDDGERYLLQQINTNVFRNPHALMINIVSITQFLAKKIAQQGGDPARETLTVIPAKSGGNYITTNDCCWRMYRFIERATAYDSVEHEGLLREVGRAFGIFQNQLADFPAATLEETIPFFHHTQKRYEAFCRAVERDAVGRAASVAEEIAVLHAYSDRAAIITDGLADGSIPCRVTHNDTKLNNIMVDDETGKGICVIDLDTVMSGSLLYDFGDSVRFAANVAAEDERELDRISLSLTRYEEFLQGFLEGIGPSITERERELLPMSVFILTYELALRFMTDYLNGDTYFKLNYLEHNLVRTRAQLRLAQDIDRKLSAMQAIGEKYRT